MRRAKSHCELVGFLAMLLWVIGGGPVWAGEELASERKPAEEIWWSLKPLQKPAVPSITSGKYKDWARTPIDQFILAKLMEKAFAPSAPADKRTLLRRVHFDLTGLPPTPEEVRAFLKDNSADAYTKVVDRLLASPR